MNLLKAWQLILNATSPYLNSTAPARVGGVVDSSTCDNRGRHFDSDRCYVYATGNTRLQLEWKVHGTTYLALGPSCHSEFYVFGLEEFEKLYPSAKRCYLSTYGAVAQAAALQAPCRATEKAGAELLMVPPYLAAECNWPAYGEPCGGRTNAFRRGHTCTVGDMAEVLGQVRRDHPGKRVLALEMGAAQDAVSVPTAKFKDPGVVFASMLAVHPGGAYRKGVDVSMPPAAPPRCGRAPPHAFSEPLSAKRYFLSFKGQMRSRMRQHVRDRYHNGEDRVIVDSNDTRYDFDALLYSSRFNLVLPGDQEFSYRFVEAVCSGGVPVLVAHHWVPPFSEFLPFESYGVLVPSGRIDDLLRLLGRPSESEVRRKRAAAIAACRHYFASTGAQVRALLEQLLLAPRTRAQPLRPSAVARGATGGPSGRRSRRSRSTSGVDGVAGLQGLAAGAAAPQRRFRAGQLRPEMRSS